MAQQDLIVGTYQQLLANATHQLVLAQSEVAQLQEELQQANTKLEQYEAPVCDSPKPESKP